MDISSRVFHPREGYRAGPDDIDVLEGAIVQGLGYALCEEMEIEDGRVMVSSLGDYKIRCMRDIPPLVTSFVTSTVGPGPFSTKAVGEAGISIVAPAISNAVYNATGVRITQLPITPEKIMEGLTSNKFRTRQLRPTPLSYPGDLPRE